MKVGGIVIGAQRQIQRTDVPIVLRLIGDRSQGPDVRIVGRVVVENLLRGGDMIEKRHYARARRLAINAAVAVDPPVERHVVGVGANLQVQRIEHAKFEQRNGSDLNLLPDGRGDVVSPRRVAGV